LQRRFQFAKRQKSIALPIGPVHALNRSYTKQT
jgi:hypothetical protein